MSLPSYETLPSSTLKSTPVCKIALPQVSPSMPTQAEAYAVLLPEGALGVGTVKVPVTPVQVAWVRMRTKGTIQTSNCTHCRFTDDSTSPVVTVRDVGFVRVEGRKTLGCKLGVRKTFSSAALEATSKALA